MFDNLSVAQTARFLDDVLFAMTVYRLPVNNCEAWTSLEGALSTIGLKANLFIYDNGPAAQDPPDSLCLTSHYQHDATNPGISVAYNSAFQIAEQIGKKWLLFLDQDTRINAKAIAAYATAVNTHPSQSLFAPVVMDSRGVLSPFRFKRGVGFRVGGFSSRYLSLHEFRAINAGLLVSSDLFRRAGGYEDSIALDFSDIAFLEKVKPICSAMCRVDAILEQEFSGTATSNRSSVLDRFKKYNQGAFHFVRCFHYPAAIRWRAFLRATKLALRWRSMEFLRVHFKTWNE